MTPDLLRPAEPGERFHPHTIPRYLVDRLVKAYELEVFVETGTYLGMTVAAVLHLFKQVFTIELDPKLAANAKWRFEAYPHVQVLEGDSGTILESLKLVDRQALIWLDAHWSGGITARQDSEIHTSVRAELKALREWQRRDHVLMLDDIDDFNGEHGYPTQDELVHLVKMINPAYVVHVLPIRRGVLVALSPESSR
jgi:hypothetical protein